MSVLSRLSGDENGALRLATSPRDEISLLSLSLVSHENHRRRRLLECRSPLLLLFCSSTVSSSSSSSSSAATSSDTTATTTSSLLRCSTTFLLEPPCPLSPSILSLATPASSRSISFPSPSPPSSPPPFVFPSFLPFQTLSLALSLDLLSRFNGVHRGTRYICRCDSRLGVHMGKEEPAKLRGAVFKILARWSWSKHCSPASPAVPFSPPPIPPQEDPWELLKQTVVAILKFVDR